jgi:hypothetical protein
MSMLLGGNVYPGDFLFARQDDGAVTVCQVHAIVPPRSMKIMWWIEHDNGPPLCLDMFRNILECKVIELHPSLESIVWYDDVVDVAFVFRPEVLEKVWTDVAGMSRVFSHGLPPTYVTVQFMKASPIVYGTLSCT